MRTTTFFVPGTSAPQGSKRHVGGGRMIESSKHVGPWRERVALVARDAVLDALTGIAYLDDSQVAHLVARKTYAVEGVSTPGVHITIESEAS